MVSFFVADDGFEVLVGLGASCDTLCVCVYESIFECPKEKIYKML